MQKKNILFLFTIIFLQINTKLVSQSTTFQFDKMNVAFKGLSNQITIKTTKNIKKGSLPNISTKYGTFEFVDSISNGKITEFQFNGEFEKMGKHTILVKSEEDTLLLYDIRCKNIPDPHFMLGLKYKAGEIERKIIRKAIGAGAVLRNFDFYYSFKTKSYICTIIKEGRIVSTYNCDNIRYSEELKETMSSLKSGDIVLFDEILVVGENGEERTIESINYRVKMMIYWL